MFAVLPPVARVQKRPAILLGPHDNAGERSHRGELLAGSGLLPDHEEPRGHRAARTQRLRPGPGHSRSWAAFREPQRRSRQLRPEGRGHHCWRRGARAGALGRRPSRAGSPALPPESEPAQEVPRGRAAPSEPGGGRGSLTSSRGAGPLFSGT